MYYLQSKRFCFIYHCILKLNFMTSYLFFCRMENDLQNMLNFSSYETIKESTIKNDIHTYGISALYNIFLRYLTELLSWCYLLTNWSVSYICKHCSINFIINIINNVSIVEKLIIQFLFEKKSTFIFSSITVEIM